MKLRISDRILVAVAGIILLAGCAGIVAQMFFGVDVVGYATRAFASNRTQIRVALIGMAVFLLLLGVYCVFVLFRHRRRKDKFILQKNEGGEIAISVKALEDMVQKCLKQHSELKVQHIYLENKKDGLLIRLRGEAAGGVSIPLTVESLQKQIRQYVTACSGVEVRGIRVQIDSSGKDAEDAPFAIAAPASKPLLRGGEKETIPVQASVTVEKKPEEPERTETQTPDPAPVAEPAPAPKQEPTPVPEEDDDRPLHQRLFSTQPEPCIVPEPPMEEGNTETDAAEPEDIAEPEEAAADAAKPLESDAAVESAETEDTMDFPAESAEDALDEIAEDVSLDGADPEFLDSLKAFDDMVTGDAKEEEAE